MIESGFEKEQRQRNEMFARWGADNALFKANIGKPSRSDIALVGSAQNKYQGLVDSGIKRNELGLRGQTATDERDIQNQRTGILQQEATASTTNAETNRFNAIAGLSSAAPQALAVSSNLGGMSRITPQAPRASVAASIDEDLDEVDPMRPRAYKNGGVIGNVKQDDGSDKVPVVAREGEYYINPETVAHIGGGDYKQGLRSLNALVREATGKEPGPSPVGKSGLRGFAAGGSVKRRLAKLEDISADVSQRAGQQAPINRADIGTTVNVDPQQARAETPKRGLIQGAKGAGGRALALLSSPAVVGAGLMAHSGNAGDQNEDAWATQQRANWGKPLAEGAEPWNNPLPYDTPITANAAREQALRLEPSRSQADEYSNSPERAAWQASLGNGQPTSSQPDAADDFRTRNATADVYRREWQRQSPGGLRNANPQALDTYNAEQQVRGTGISAQRQANGVMEFSGSGPAPKAQYIDASGNPTNEWQDTSQYRDAVVRSLGSNDPAMQQRGLAQAMQLQQRNQRGVSTGDPRMDDLLSKMEPREAASVFKALYGGQGADGKGPKAAPYAEQQKRVIDALGEEGAAKAMPEIQQAQMQLARQLIQSGQATPEQAEALVQNGQLISRLTNAYKLRDFLAQNGQWGEAASGAGGWGTAAGLAAGGLTLGLTRNPGAAAKAAAAGAALGAGVGGAQGFTQGAQGFEAEMPLTGLMDITPLPDGDYQIGNAVIPKAMVQKNYQLFGLTAPPK